MSKSKHPRTTARAFNATADQIAQDSTGKKWGDGETMSCIVDIKGWDGDDSRLQVRTFDPVDGVQSLFVEVDLEGNSNPAKAALYEAWAEQRDGATSFAYFVQVTGDNDWLGIANEQEPDDYADKLEAATQSQYWVGVVQAQ